MTQDNQRAAFEAQIDLPPLPGATLEHPTGNLRFYGEETLKEYARQAIAHDRQQRGEPCGWLYDWTHSSATGKPDEQITAFGTNKSHIEANPNNRNIRAVYASPQPAEPVGEVVVTKDEHGRIVAVTRQDREGRILKVIAISEGPQPAEPVSNSFTTPDCPECGCVQDGGCLCVPSKEPVKGPSDGEIDAIAGSFMSTDDGICLLDNHRGFARALLARYGDQS